MHVLHHDVDIQVQHPVDGPSVGVDQVPAEVDARIGMQDIGSGQAPTNRSINEERSFEAMESKLDGIIIPAVTPFDQKGDVRLDWFGHNLSRWSNTAVRGIMVLGTNGEFRSLSDDEARSLIAAAAKRRGDKTLIAGVGRESTRLTVEFIDSIAGQVGRVDYVSVLPPHYFAKAMSPAALIEHYSQVADRSPFPVLLYVAPGYSNGLVIPPSVVSHLADHPNIVGIKDTSTDQLTAYMLAVGKRADFSVLAGTMNTIMTDLFFGGPGGVVSAANYFPNECSGIVGDFRLGRTDQALDAYRQLQRLIKITGGMSGVASLKACMNLLGYKAGIPRRPLAPLSAQGQADIRQALADAGKLVSED